MHAVQQGLDRAFNWIEGAGGGWNLTGSPVEPLFPWAPVDSEGWQAEAAAGYDMLRVLGRLDLAVNYPELGIGFDKSCLLQ